MGDRIEKGNHNQRPAAQTGSAKLTRSSLCLCGFVVLFTVAIPLWAQQSKVYRDGNSWVEEMTGTLPVTRDVHVTTDLGSVQVQGGSPRITYLVRKRSYAPTEKDARKQFEQMRISAVKNGETDLIQGRIVGRAMMRFGAEFILQVPRDLNVVRVETRGGSLAFTSIAANIVASTGAGLIKLDDLAGPVKIVSGGGNIEGGNRVDNLHHSSYRMQIGARGDLGDGWNYDVYGQYGESVFSENYQNEFSKSRVQEALEVDPVADLIARVEKEYQAGQDNYQAGHLEAAKQNFDSAFNLLLGSGYDLRSGNSDDRLERELDSVSAAQVWNQWNFSPYRFRSSGSRCARPATMCC